MGAGDVDFKHDYGEEPEFGEYHYVPDTQSLATSFKSCLQESEPLPRDFTQLMDGSVFKFDTNLIPECIKLYTDLKVKHEALKLIPPQFETPLPDLRPAVLPTNTMEFNAPALDLFDLDEQFSSEKARLAQLTNKCSDDDLNYYIQEASEILGVTGKVTGHRS